MTEGFNKLPLMRELSPKVTEGEKSLTRFDIPSGLLFYGGSKPPPYSSCKARFGTVKTVPYGWVKTSSEEEVAFPKEMTEEGLFNNTEYGQIFVRDIPPQSASQTAPPLRGCFLFKKERLKRRSFPNYRISSIPIYLRSASGMVTLPSSF